MGLPHLAEEELGHDHILLDGLAARTVSHQHRGRKHFLNILFLLFVGQEGVGPEWMVPGKLHLQQTFAVLAQQEVEVEGLEHLLLCSRLIIV